MFSLEDVCINGYSVDPLWSDEVGAGQTAVDDVTFASDLFEKLGVSEAQEVSFTLRVYDSDDWFSDYIVSQSYSIYPTGLDAASVNRPARRTGEGEKVIVDDENVLFVIYGVKEDSFWGPALDCYVENKTEDRISFSWDNVSVNGSVLDVYWAEEVPAGAGRYRDLVIDDAEFEDLGITGIENVGFDLTVSFSDGLEDDVLIEQNYTYVP